MGLVEVKAAIKIVSADPKTNKQLLDMIKSEGDCFGVGYSDNDDCKKCNILTELGDKRGPLWQFCKELVPGSEEPVGKEEEKKAEKVEKPKAVENEDTDSGKEESKEDKEKENGGDKEMPKGNNIELAKKLLAEGKSEDEVIAQIKDQYINKGKDADFSEKRAKVYLKLAKKS